MITPRIDPFSSKMQIVKGRPPNFEKILAVFPAASGNKVLFCYGNKIYSPSGDPIPVWLVAHEEVHCLQQGDDVEGWWDKYLADPAFRFTQELPAHRHEWRVWLMTAHRSRGDRRLMMAAIASRLAGPLYGRMVNSSSAKAMILKDDPI